MVKGLDLKRLAELLYDVINQDSELNGFRRSVAKLGSSVVRTSETSFVNNS